MEIEQALDIIEESGLVLEKKLRSEMSPEELADARAKSKARRLARREAAKAEEKRANGLARLDVFRKADVGDCEIADGRLEISGRDFFFTIDPELKYHFTVFNDGPEGDEEIDFGGQFKEAVLDKDPSYIHDLIRRKVDRAKEFE